MTKPAVEFNLSDNELHLIYRPRDDTNWVRKKFDRGEELLVKGTFHLRSQDMLEDASKDAANVASGDDDAVWVDDHRMVFVIATAEGEYFRFTPQILGFETPVLLHRDARPDWKWFSAERKVSILGIVQSLGLERIVIGGPAPDAIPIPEYERLLNQLPTPHELRRYVQARVSTVIRQYTEPVIDAEELLNAYVDKRTTATPPDIEAPFRQFDVAKYAFALDRLQAMLANETGTSEAQWQLEIVEIILLLNPRYIKAFTEVRLWDADASTWRRIDILLVDASGNVDVIEIKKPLGKPIMLPTRYRDHHLPMRDLVGAMGQANHYLRHLNRWGATGEDYLTQLLSASLPEDFKIRIINPSGIVIMGRSNTLSDVQLREFEMLRRDSKGVVDIVTYDDLLARLRAVLDQLRRGPALSMAPAYTPAE
ncbi:Shedu immune nuclease family protein [Roseateles sp.]|uniref:Shedu immune nuclease family protein n=1 Tax=Roseateles sp. TaxID=1971397 RepID=UPI003D0C35FB